ncbi:MAG TPA: hypothetical protein PJ984_02080 [Candidatus Saccharibacteria bacterium]|jgi:hypothetical protein|nr:hypothetical protein [Patescibacteria group bacterium]HMS31163.1 hypothetical protein [Candidatus Saccharibacteria bacterium]
MSFGETVTSGVSEAVQEGALDSSLKLLKDVFGVCLVESGDDLFERDYLTPHIHASEYDIYTGSAQRVPPCGDQTPAYFGINGPIFEDIDTI